jgi:uncharacterized protein (TIGR02145 family)
MIAGGQTYSAVKIGTQTWTAEHMRHNAGVGNTHSYDNISADDETYGKLYDWVAAMEGSTTESAQGICAAGWHVPSDQDWTDLENHLGSATAGTQLTQLGSSGIGFEAKLAGHRTTNGSFNDRGEYASMWSSTESGGSFAHMRDLRTNRATLNRVAHSRGLGFSVRCLMD